MDVEVLAVDFDGTLCEHDFPDIGQPKEAVIEYVKVMQEMGWRIILWTVREGLHLEDAVEWCREHGIEFDAINENVVEFRYPSRKVYADIYLDDRAMLPEDV